MPKGWEKQALACKEARRKSLHAKVKKSGVREMGDFLMPFCGGRSTLFGGLGGIFCRSAGGIRQSGILWG